MKKFITQTDKQTQELGKLFAQELKAVCLPEQGTVVCLSGDLGSGKTTFTQGLLKGLKIKGPYTSPTFVVMKKYNNVYHIDAYRIKNKDLLGLGWEEMIADNKNIIIIEWAERVEKIIPKNAIWIRFRWIDRDKRELKFS